MVVATHDLELALAHADRLWLVDRGTVHDRTPGELMSDGTLLASFSTPGAPDRVAARPARRPAAPCDGVSGLDGRGRLSKTACSTSHRNKNTASASRKRRWRRDAREQQPGERHHPGDHDGCPAVHFQTG